MVFGDVWDGSQVVQTLAKMDRLDLKAIRRGDVVIMDCHVRRYRISDMARTTEVEKRTNRIGGPWKQWRMSLQLAALIKLWSIPRNQDPELDSGDERLMSTSIDDEIAAF